MTEPRFGTSGLRGLANALTADVVDRYVHAFLSVCPVGCGVYIGEDLRASSPALGRMVCDAVLAAGHDAFVCGPCPTPALALAAQDAGAAAIMVTGSHIPSDRNGLKFYSTAGEITKADETAIVSALGCRKIGTQTGRMVLVDTAEQAYLGRYTAAFGQALRGMRIGVYQHSAVGRDDLRSVLQDLGAVVIPLGRSDQFVPIDTEAVADHVRHDLRFWAKTDDLDAIVSTDADGDRPLLTDEAGQLVPGDILGQITARALGAAHVITPISSNSGVAQLTCFETVQFTMIGSPFVLQGMAAHPGMTVGYEANGGFILGFDEGPLKALRTRDALLPICQVLVLARDAGVAALVAQEPARVTRSDRLQDIDTGAAKALLDRVAGDPSQFFDVPPTALTRLDGMRFTLFNGEILHLRLSGNAPELRVYVEAANQTKADALLAWAMQRVDGALGAAQPAS